ncbi:MAG: glycosyltransferase family 2 protein [Anaerolineaceae bacterium]|nr:glycosyltransferase family 2 protein [Anaerolineaceae bacterium]
MKISIIIPAFNEEACIGKVLEELSSYVSREEAEILVVDGGSSDNTVQIAESAGVQVIHEPRRGYGRACAAGLFACNGDIVIFMDADGADDPGYLSALLQPIQDGLADLVLGSRIAGMIEKGAMPWHQYFGNWLSAALIRLIHKESITDLSPFRAVIKSQLMNLKMKEMTYGWPTEMIIKAIAQSWRIVEIPVTSRSRIGGKSKISGTIKGTVLATYHIMRMIMMQRKGN